MKVQLRSMSVRLVVGSRLSSKVQLFKEPNHYLKSAETLLWKPLLVVCIYHMSRAKRGQIIVVVKGSIQPQLTFKRLAFSEQLCIFF